MSRAPRLSADVRREQALDAALELIVSDGYAAVNMEAIARRMGVAKPVVYSAWGDLGSLLHALLEREEGRAFAQLAEAMPATGGADLTAWLTSLARTVSAAPDPWRLMLLPADGTPQRVRDRVDEGRRVVLAQVGALLAPLLGTGADAELAAHAVLSAMEQLGRLMLADPATYPPERVAAFATSALRQLDLLRA